MIVMVFEYRLDPAHTETYNAHASVLRQRVREIEGFVSVERFRSESDPTKILALGYFEHEQAVTEWRNLPAHRLAQQLGREQFFMDYHLCMAEVLRDYTHSDRTQAPADSKTTLHT